MTRNKILRLGVERTMTSTDMDSMKKPTTEHLSDFQDRYSTTKDTVISSCSSYFWIRIEAKASGNGRVEGMAERCNLTKFKSWHPL